MNDNKQLMCITLSLEDVLATLYTNRVLPEMDYINQQKVIMAYEDKNKNKNITVHTRNATAIYKESL